MSKNNGDYWKVLEKCIEIAKEREVQHGNYLDTYAIYKDAYGSIDKGLESLVLLKISRIVSKIKKNKPVHVDDYIDLINYCAMRIHSKDE